MELEQALKKIMRAPREDKISAQEFADSVIALNDAAWRVGAAKRMWDLFHDHYEMEKKQKKNPVKTKQLFKEIAAVYESEETRKKLLDAEEKAVKPLLPKSGLVLDAGCGTGRYSRLMAKRGCKVVGIDFSPAMLKQAKRRSKGLGITYKQGDLLNLNFKDNTFDHAVCTLVLNHNKEWKKVVKELVRVTKPKGTIVISVMHQKRFGRKRTMLFPFSKTEGRMLWNTSWRIKTSELVATMGCEAMKMTEISNPFSRNTTLPLSMKFLLIAKFRKQT